MKKISVILLLLLLVLPLFLSLAKSQNPIAGMPAGLGPDSALGNALNPDNTDNLQASAEGNLSYLQKEWKKILLKNKVVQTLDIFCKKIDIVFVVLFSQHYELSIKLLLIIVFWIWLASRVGVLLTKAAGFRDVLSWVFGILASIIAAQLQIIRIIVEAVIWLVAEQKEWWIKIIICAVIAFVMIIAHFAIKLAAKRKEEQRKKEAEDQARAAQQETVAFTKGLKEGIKAATTPSDN